MKRKINWKDIITREDNALSLSRVLALLTFVLWFFVTVYATITEANFAHYDTLSLCMLVSVLTCMAGKYVDSKLISVKNESKNETKEVRKIEGN